MIRSEMEVIIFGINCVSPENWATHPLRHSLCKSVNQKRRLGGNELPLGTDVKLVRPNLVVLVVRH